MECAVAITAIDSYDRPTTAVCRFCQYFGKDNKDENRKRKLSQNIKMYTKRWRADKMKEHNSKMHSERWLEYQYLSRRGKCIISMIMGQHRIIAYSQYFKETLTQSV